jgi:hypothetical protein
MAAKERKKKHKKKNAKTDNISSYIVLNYFNRKQFVFKINFWTYNPHGLWSYSKGKAIPVTGRGGP